MKSWFQDKAWWSKVVIISAIVIMIAHTLYMNIAGISFGQKELCVLYQNVPRWLFCFYEYFIELCVIVLIGIFGGVLIEQYSKKAKRFFPKNQWLAFLYASFLPVCSCGVIPIVESMKKVVKLRTLITFIISAPLLNPYIIFMSITVLGLEYAILRIVSAFVLAISSGFMVEYLAKVFNFEIPGVYDNCQTTCSPMTPNVYLKTMGYMRKLLPYILLAGALSFTLEFIHPQQYLESLSFSNNVFSNALMLVVGIPVYVCNGADVLFLKPLLQFTDLSMGAAMTFSLASSAICISSIVMLVKFFGKKVTLAIIASITIIIIIESSLITAFL